MDARDLDLTLLMGETAARITFAQVSADQMEFL
jgi:hypothetical protein